MRTPRSVPNDALDLLRWYDRVKRDLPWRRRKDPYRIWLSEIMLQQTQVKTVVPYFEAFVECFPRVEDLAAADLDEVLARWSGLGYYRRARQLHAAAREIVERGTFPETAVGLQTLPGIGPYTAAAVASIAFDEVVPVLDGNVERLLCRRLALAEDPKRAAVRRILVAAAAELLDPQRPGDSNQALMELGAVVCRPRQPQCNECPIAEGCAGKDLGPESFPVPRKRRAVERLQLATVIVERQGKLLLFRRSAGSAVMAGFWELPSVPKGSESAMVQALASTYGGRWTLQPLEKIVRHSITYRALTLELYCGTLTAGDSVAEGPEAIWADAARRDELALSSMVEKVLKKVSATS